MREQRGKQAAASFLFKLAESVGTQGISFVVSVVLARLLDPSDYGVLTMLTVFIAVSQVFVQSGLNTALIQKKDVDETDLSSVFYVSLGIAVVLYGLLFLLAPAIGAFFAMEALAPVLRVLALILLPGALISVQNAVIAREMAFRRLMTASLICTTLSGVVGIAMAARGSGLLGAGGPAAHQPAQPGAGAAVAGEMAAPGAVFLGARAGADPLRLEAAGLQPAGNRLQQPAHRRDREEVRSGDSGLLQPGQAVSRTGDERGQRLHSERDAPRAGR